MPDGRTVKFNQTFHLYPEQSYAIQTDFHAWRKENNSPEYSHLDWTGEEDEMRKRMGEQQTAI